MTRRIQEAVLWAALVATSIALWTMFMVALLAQDQDLGVPAHVIESRP